MIEADKFRPYLDIIEDHEIDVRESKRQTQITSTEVNKMPLETMENAITFLSSMSNGLASRYGIQNRIIVVS